MQDIVFKRAPTAKVGSTSEIGQVIVTKRPRLDVTKMIGISTTAMANLQRLIAPESRRFTVRQFAKRPQLPAPSLSPIYKLPSVPKLPKIDSGPLRKQLATPLGKFTLIQGVALAILIAVVGAMTVHANRQPASSISQAESAVVGYRKFLPSVVYNAAVTVPGIKLADVSTPLAQEIWATPWNIGTLATSGLSFRSVSAFWGSVDIDSVTVKPKADWTTWDTYVAKQPSPHPAYYLTVSGDPNLTLVMLSDPAKRAQHIKNLLTLVQQHGFNGIDIDYEGLGRENRDQFSLFASELDAQFHSAHKLVALTVEARLNNDVPMDWHLLAGSADELRIMAYDYHGRATGTPGPIAPIGWLQEILQYAQQNVAPDKLIVGIGDYGYDWQQSSDGSWSGIGLSADQAMGLAKKNGQPIVRQTGIDPRGYDVGSVPEFTYTETSGSKHDVWFEDANSLLAKETLVSQYHPAGIILWTVGLKEPS